MATVDVLTPSSYTGIDTITTQINKKLLKRGFQFNVLLCGQTGLGKSTLVNTLFSSNLVHSKGRFHSDESLRGTTEIINHSQVILEEGVKLRLNIIDTPGFSDLVNNDGCWDPIIKYIKDQHSSYLRKELTALREKFIVDSRVHVTLYFINPTGHSLRPIDLVVLKKLTEVVNVVPVIAKSDSLTIEERDLFKKRIKAELEQNNIRLYPIDTDEHDDDEIKLNSIVRNMIPFAIVGSENIININGKNVRARQNKWGTINVEDENHCEFIHLRNFLLRTHLQDLIESTAQIHYEAFRSKQLLALKESSQSKQAAQQAAQSQQQQQQQQQQH